MAETMPGGAGGYVAFISYSHKDAAIGRWLHRKLEGYRLPKRLAGTQGEDGEVPARLTPIFRDRDELPAAGDLSQKVRAALAVSCNLIIVCSPHSAVSPWVAKEIATFRELHPGRPVFTAIVEGEPDQCFAPTLLEGGVEPLAADLRKDGDGRRLGFLKLVAGLAGVGLDDLVQRDAARRIRRVTWITAAAVVAMVMMAFLTVLAMNARAEAQRQRQEAEGLVEFMLTDLRDNLRSVGRLDALTAVNQRALAYYQRQNIQGLPPQSLERRAKILHAMGEDDEKRDLRTRALQQFQEAARTTSALLAADPSDPPRMFSHAQSKYWLGYMAFGEKDWPRTATHWRDYKHLADKLVRSDPLNLEWAREAAYAEGNLCTLELVKEGSPTQALQSCQAAVSQMERVRALRPNDEKSIADLANRYGWLAKARERKGDKDGALAAYQTQMRLLKPLAQAAPQDAKIQDQWMRTLIGVAEFLRANGRPRESESYLTQARTLAEKLIRHDPANAKWRQWLQRVE